MISSLNSDVISSLKVSNSDVISSLKVSNVFLNKQFLMLHFAMTHIFAVHMCIFATPQYFADLSILHTRLKGLYIFNLNSSYSRAIEKNKNVFNF